jgi:superfamily II DNA or RNA helicase
MAKPFEDAKTLLRRLERRFPPGVCARGERYARRGHVAIVSASAGELKAEVQGEELYSVVVRLGDGSLGAVCSCRYFVDSDDLCKHIWATLVVAAERGHLSEWAAVRGIYSALYGFDDSAPPPRGPNLRLAYSAPATPTTPANAPAGAPLAASSSWRDILAGHSIRRGQGTSRVLRPELRYVVDLDEARRFGRIVIRTMESWKVSGAAKWRKAHVRHPVSSFAGPADAAILAMLEAAASLSQGFSYQAMFLDFELPDQATAEVVERLCAEGRAHLGDPEAPPLRWEPPYTLALEGAARDDGDGLVIRTWLVRGDERLPATLPAAFAGGVVFWTDRAAAVDARGSGVACFEAERGGAPAHVPANEVLDLLEALSFESGAPPLVLPPEHTLDEVTLPGRPYAVLTTKDGPGVAIEAGVDYGSVSATLAPPARVVIDRAGRRSIVRDAALEERAREVLAKAGARDVVVEGRALGAITVTHRATAGRLESTVAALLAERWRVEVDGVVRRPLVKAQVTVTTGIDWLAVDAEADFGGVLARIPELLAALRHQRRTVLLADGSVGVLSDEWAERLRRWAALAKEREGELRFGKTQAAVVLALAEDDTAVSLDADLEGLRTRMRRFEGVRPLDAPPTMRGVLREYQREGLGWLAALRALGVGGCLADEMGLGKTVQILAMLDARRAGWGDDGAPPKLPSLVVAPRSVLPNWAAEAERFTPGLRLLLHEGPGRADPGPHFAEHDVVLTTYGVLRADADELAEIAFDYVVLDEAQAIKTASTASAQAARSLRARHRVALSGTPVENHLGELASLLDFLNPGILGAASSLASLSKGARQLEATTGPILTRAIRPFFLRRTKRDVAQELPDRVEQTVACPLGAEQRRLYDELHRYYRGAVSDRVAAVGFARSTTFILEALVRLRQAACHPGLVDPAKRFEPSAKLDALLDQLESLRSQGQKALVFSQFTSLLDIVQARLDSAGIVRERLDGKTRDRARRVARFQEDEGCSVFLLSLKAGGVGLNLTAAQYVFLLDPWWNPAVEAQAIDRAHRIGQSRTVFAYKLMAPRTVEEKIVLLQAQKRELAEALFGEEASALGGLTREDLAWLLE